VGSYPEGTFDVDVEEGFKYPDILGCGEYPLLIVSERVINSWEKASVDCFERFNVGIRLIKSRKLRGATQPKYYRVEPSGICKVDLAASGVRVTAVCPVCGELKREPQSGHGFQLKTGSWDGSDLFRDNVLFPRVIFCTHKIVKVSFDNQLTNCVFTKMEDDPTLPESRITTL
jgi:hypothetical protein